MSLDDKELSRLLKIADICDHEANTWAEGFAIHRGKEIVWPDRENDSAHIRFIHLKSASRDLRLLVKKHSREPSEQKAPEKLSSS